MLAVLLLLVDSRPVSACTARLQQPSCRPADLVLAVLLLLLDGCLGIWLVGNGLQLQHTDRETR